MNCEIVLLEEQIFFSEDDVVRWTFLFTRILEGLLIMEAGVMEVQGKIKKAPVNDIYAFIWR